MTQFLQVGGLHTQKEGVQKHSGNKCLSKFTHCEVRASKSNGLAIMVCKQF